MSTPETTSVLILSADTRDQHVIFDSLDECGFEAIYSAQSIDQAREQLEQIPVNLMIADLQLGATEIDELRADAGITYLIALASGHGPAARIEWEEIPNGFDECVRSPVDPDELVFRLIRLMDDTGEKGADSPAARRLSVLSRYGEGLEGAVFDLLATAGTELHLGILAVIERGAGNDDDSVRLVIGWTPEGPLEELGPLLDELEVNQVLNGRPMVFRSGAPVTRSKADAPPIDTLVGLPLRASEGVLRGALIAGAEHEPQDWESALALLEVLGWRIADQLEIKRLRIESRVRGLQDSLTLLPNRLLFNDRLEHALRQARRTGEMFALLFVDLDRFKSINDSLGHSVGDSVLLGVAERLKQNLRKSDTVARYAGDEFTIILRHVVNREDVIRAGKKLTELLAQPLTIEANQELQVTASIGICFYPDDGDSSELLLKRADSAMYDAKGRGRNSCAVFVRREEGNRQQRMLLESKMRRAQAEEELRVFYQPQINSESEDIEGMEALIRWQHPDLGLISPGFFIPLAEETGLIVPMGEWLLRMACREAVEWQDRYGLPLTVGVNLSALQLRQPELVELVTDALDQSGLNPTHLDLEITESLSIKSIPGLRETLGRIRNLGCRISIDDFGTGQSSLDYLKRFPADRIKIDQAFVRNIGIDPDDEAIVRATISMAHQLQMEVVAEGVELEEHLEFLHRHGCDQVQGFLFCRPLSSEQFDRLLSERQQLVGHRIAS